MVRTKYEAPTPTFPYKIKWRLQMLSRPRRGFVPGEDKMPEINPRGIRKSALRGSANDRLVDLNYPYTWRLFNLKRRYRTFFPPPRIGYVDKYIELSNATCYSKLANCVIDLKGKDHKETSKRKRGWAESDWKKHMDYINQIAGPKRQFEPEPLDRGPRKPIEQLITDLTRLAFFPEHKRYRRLSQDRWYKNPSVVPRSALTYVISDRVKKLATPKTIPVPE